MLIWILSQDVHKNNLAKKTLATDTESAYNGDNTRGGTRNDPKGEKMEEFANKIVGIIKAQAPSYDGRMWEPSVGSIAYEFGISEKEAIAALDLAIDKMLKSGDYVDTVGGLYHKETMERYERQVMDFVACQLAKEHGEE